MRFHYAILRRALCLGLATAAGLGLAAPATAAPARPRFGPAMDPMPSYDGQSKCDPEAKPGVLAFQAMVMKAYPSTGWGGIGRDCAIGGQSEHKEGRAWDWTVNAAIPDQKAKADALIEWLLEDDKYGNDHAMASRVGIMYLIWNRKIWMPYSGWKTYCVQKPAGCKDPDDGGLRHPHTDHVHFSFTWDGAYKKTSFWHPQRSMIASGSAIPTGYGQWLTGANGNVFSLGGYSIGSVDDAYLKQPIVAMAPTATGTGYWLTTRAGKVFAFGDAPRKGSVSDKTQIADMESPATSNGYWLVSEGGRVFPFGKASFFGGMKEFPGAAAVTDIAGTPTGQGYWLTTEDGRIYSFGDAAKFDTSNDIDTHVVAGDGNGSSGFWTVSDKGRVRAYGDAKRHGDLSEKSLDVKVVSLLGTVTGRGYWLITDTGRTFAFGDAQRLGSVRAL